VLKHLVFVDQALELLLRDEEVVYAVAFGRTARASGDGNDEGVWAIGELPQLVENRVFARPGRS
jgi:hypothetical protein